MKKKIIFLSILSSFIIQIHHGYGMEEQKKQNKNNLQDNQGNAQESSSAEVSDNNTMRKIRELHAKITNEFTPLIIRIKKISQQENQKFNDDHERETDQLKNNINQIKASQENKTKEFYLNRDLLQTQMDNLIIIKNQINELSSLDSLIGKFLNGMEYNAFKDKVKKNTQIITNNQQQLKELSTQIAEDMLKPEISPIENNKQSIKEFADKNSENKKNGLNQKNYNYREDMVHFTAASLIKLREDCLKKIDMDNAKQFNNFKCEQIENYNKFLNICHQECDAHINYYDNIKALFLSQINDVKVLISKSEISNKVQDYLNIPAERYIENNMQILYCFNDIIYKEIEKINAKQKEAQRNHDLMLNECKNQILEIYGKIFGLETKKSDQSSSNLEKTENNEYTKIELNLINIKGSCDKILQISDICLELINRNSQIKWNDYLYGTQVDNQTQEKFNQTFDISYRSIKTEEIYASYNILSGINCDTIQDHLKTTLEHISKKYKEIKQQWNQEAMYPASHNNGEYINNKYIRLLQEMMEKMQELSSNIEEISLKYMPKNNVLEDQQAQYQQNQQ